MIDEPVPEAVQESRPPTWFDTVAGFISQFDADDLATLHIPGVTVGLPDTGHPAGPQALDYDERPSHD
jgi:hypothetical protein